jgi:hypothetical protein
MGPIAVFDKSFLQMLNLDEAAIFDALYSAVICPIFYTGIRRRTCCIRRFA